MLLLTSSAVVGVMNGVEAYSGYDKALENGRSAFNHLRCGTQSRNILLQHEYLGIYAIKSVLTLQSTTVIILTTCFNIQKLRILLSQRIYIRYNKSQGKVNVTARHESVWGCGVMAQKVGE
jgi:hypothetical protein